MTHDPSNTDLPAALRLQLRGLRTDVTPTDDLWPGIAARIAAQPQDASAAGHRRFRTFPALATAAALALAVGLGWQLRPEAPAPAGTASHPPVAGAAADAPLVVAAEAMTLEYRGALRELSAVRPATAEYAALLELDASADAVREALAHDPDARFLLGRLQRIYAQRLSLTQRLARA